VVFRDAALKQPPRIGIVVSRFSKVTRDGKGIGELLLEGCLERLRKAELPDDAVTLLWVPGAFELPIAAQHLAPHCAAVIALGCVIRGETPHFDFVAGEASRGIAQVALSTGVPVIFGVLTTDNDQQALDRVGGAHGHKGVEAAEAALEMVTLLNNYKLGRKQGESQRVGLAFERAASAAPTTNSPGQPKSPS